MNRWVIVVVLLVVSIVTLHLLGVGGSGSDEARPAILHHEPLSPSTNSDDPGDDGSARIESAPFRGSMPDDLESDAEKESVPRAPSPQPLLTPDDLQVYERLLEATKTVPERSGTSTWSEARHGQVPPHLSLFTIDDMDLDRAIDFYKYKLIESIGRSSESLSSDDTLKAEIDVLTSAWLLSRKLHQRLGWVSEQLRQHHQLPDDQARLKELSRRLRGYVSNSVNWYERMSKRFYDKHLHTVGNRRTR
jgi:hypothetical protein